MPYNSIISRSNAAALVPEDVSNAMLQGLEARSAVLDLFTRINVPASQTRFPVISALPTAYFVTGDTGLKQTTQAAWANKYINIEELAAIVPIPEAVLDDVSFDVWGSIRPLLEQAVARTLDLAVLIGTNKPASWDPAIAPTAVTAGNTRTRGTATQAQGGIAEDFNQLFAKVEEDGYSVDGVVARNTYRAFLRSARDTTGQALADLAGGTVLGVALQTDALKGLWPTGGGAGTNVEAVAGDWSQGVCAVRQDFTYKILDQAVIQDNSGVIQYNLAQQDMVALRLTFRCGFAVSNPLNYDEPVEANRYPFAVMRF